MKRQNLQSRPPKISNDLEAFINGAESKKLELVSSINSNGTVNQNVSSEFIVEEVERFPWDEPNVRIDVKKPFALRFSEPDMLKLQYIQKKTNKSMHKFCLEHLVPAIEAEIKRLKNWHL